MKKKFKPLTSKEELRFKEALASYLESFNSK